MRESREYERHKRERARRYDNADAREHRRRQTNRRKKSSGGNNLPLVIAGIVIAVIAIVLLGSGLFKEIGGSREKADLSEYFGETGEGGTILIMNGLNAEGDALIQNGKPFVPMAMANDLYDNFYYDGNEGHLLVTGATSTKEGAQGNDYFLSGETVYISLDFINRFVPMSYEVYEDPSRIDLITQATSVVKAEVSEETEMRVSADKQSAILMEIKKGESVQILDENDEWAEIRYQAVKGYIEKEGLSEGRDSSTAALAGGAEADASYARNLRDHKIVLGFHNLAVSDANSYLKDATAQTKGMNVIAPTWFSLADNEGSVSDIGNAEYVSNAHSMGYEVWAVADDFTNSADINEVLSKTSKRLILEQNLINLAKTYGVEGINIDFELISGETGDDFAQFLRELSIYTRAEKLVLSVDNYVPQDYTDFYRRDIQGRVADYVIIMGYDEHTAASGEAGSVASLGFVTQGIEDTLKEVPAAQIINAVPFYTRKWMLEAGTLSCESLGMRDAQAFLADNGVQAAWDAETCQNYATFEKNGVTYSIWMEDAESISSKLAVMTAHDIGGVGCWKLTQETPDIWDVISTYYPSGN